MAGITARRNAKKIADILNSVMGNGRGQARQKPHTGITENDFLVKISKIYFQKCKDFALDGRMLCYNRTVV
jgi:hypothetical protein